MTTDPMPGYMWVKVPYWQDPDGRHWPIPEGISRIEAEAMAVTYGPRWSVVDLDVQTKEA